MTSYRVTSYQVTGHNAAREAMWPHFGGSTEPAALQVGVGKVCAVSGKPWSGTLSRDPQNYVVLLRAAARPRPGQAAR